MGAGKERNTSDFIVIVFVLIVAGTMCALTATAIALSLFTDKKVDIFFTVILEMMKTLIAALVGYLAGKNTTKE